MAALRPPGIVGMADGPPLDALTWSGITKPLFGAIRRRGALLGAVDAHTPLADRLSQAASFRTRRRAWWQAYFGGVHVAAPLARSLRTRAGRRRGGTVLRTADAVLQIGTWYDFSGGPALGCSYHDGNLATYLERPDVELDRRSRGVRRAWEAERRLYDRLDLVMPMSEWLARAFIDDFGVDPTKVVAVGAGANL